MGVYLSRNLILCWNSLFRQDLRLAEICILLKRNTRAKYLPVGRSAAASAGKVGPRVKGGSQDKEEAALRERLIYLSALIGSRLILPPFFLFTFWTYSYAMSSEHRDDMQYKDALRKLYELFAPNFPSLPIVSLVESLYLGGRLGRRAVYRLPPLSRKSIENRGSMIDSSRKSTRAKEGWEIREIFLPLSRSTQPNETSTAVITNEYPPRPGFLPSGRRHFPVS